MTLHEDILLCERVRAGRCERLFAVLDELTLTYCVTVRVDGGHGRRLRSHFSTLRAARSWAAAYADGGSAGP
ncbi:MAG TPA: hypothetical protein VNS09_27650 [Solirubrobacter sp.]|nr:hypothetical protein [Solirubrobacter sp.]